MKLITLTSLVCSITFLSWASLPIAAVYTGEREETSPSQKEMAKNLLKSRIRFEVDKGKLAAFVNGANGEKQPFTFGSFIDLGAQEVSGKKLSELSIDKTTPIIIFVERNNQGALVTYLIDPNGQKQRLFINNLIVALADSLTERKGNPSPNMTKAMNPDTYFEIDFERDAKGNLGSVLTHIDGRKEPLNLGNLAAAIAELIPNCTLTPNEQRTLYLTLEKNPTIENKTKFTGSLKSNVERGFIVQTNPFGVKEEFNIDNLLTAVAETLQNCPGIAQGALNKDAPKKPYLMIRLEKDEAKGDQLNTVLYTVDGEKMDLSLGTLLVAATDFLPCQDVGRKESIEIEFERGQSYIIDEEGKRKPFNILSDITQEAAYLPFYQGKFCQKE